MSSLHPLRGMAPSSLHLRAIALLFFAAGVLPAQVPQLINYQGRVVVGTTNFNGTGQFKFALVNATGTTTYWSNNNSSVNGSEPSAAVSLSVSNGLYSVLLGDATLPNMTVVPNTVFNNNDVRLRIWFNDGTNGSQLLTPDQRIAAVGYALIAGTVPDGAITSAKIATQAVTATQLANFAVNSTKVDPAQVQLRVTGTAPAGSFITGINQNGTVTTAVGGGSGDITGVNAGTGLTGGGTNGDVALGIASGGVNTAQLADDSITSTKIAPLAVSGADIAASSIARDHLLVSAPPANGQVLTSIGSGLSWTTPGGGSGPWSLNGSSAFYSGGNVGIGTNSPASKLHLSGAADALRLSGPAPFVTLQDTSAGLFSRIEGAGAGMTLKTQGATPGGSNPGGLLHLNGTGSVGIGTTAPAHQLSIIPFSAGAPTWTSANWTGSIELANASAIGWRTNTSGQAFGMGHTNGIFAMFRTLSNPGSTGNPALYDFVITDNGNVGIGTTTPTAKLDVAGNAQITGNAQTSGNAIQARDKGGWAKAMIHVNADGTIARAYNGITGASGGSAGFTTTRFAAGDYKVDFNFQVTDRFVSITLVTMFSMTSGIQNGIPFPFEQNDVIFVQTRDSPGGGLADTAFTLFVY